MGEQPKPVEDEVERALASMRAGFLSASEQIATSIASLDEHLEVAPNQERAAVRAAVGRLVAAHERIVAKVVHLPASSWDSFKVMVGAVKAQQTILDQVSHLVKEHVLPRQLESLSLPPFPGAPPPPEAEPLPHVEASFPSRRSFHAHPGEDGFGPNDTLHPGDDFRREAGPIPWAQSDAGLHLRARAGARGRSETGARAPTETHTRARRDEDIEDEPRSLLALARERTAGFGGLAAMLAVGIVLSVLPREKLQEAGAKLFELVGPGRDAAVSEDRPPTQLTVAAVPRSVERVPSASGAAASPPPQPPAIAPPEQKPATASQEAPAVARPVPKRAAAEAASAEPAVPPASVAEERFVPVVFTHKEHAVVMRALSDLKRQYPNILIGLQGEVLPVDLGKKGIWHRLVLLPAGPRPQAARICDQLAAKGYDRCWVKSY
jgi:hypothetical protein